MAALVSDRRGPTKAESRVNRTAICATVHGSVSRDRESDREPCPSVVPGLPEPSPQALATPLADASPVRRRRAVLPPPLVAINWLAVLVLRYRCLADRRALV